MQRLSRNHDAHTRKSCAGKHLGPQFAHQLDDGSAPCGPQRRERSTRNLGKRGTGQSGLPNSGGSGMAIRPNNEERGFGADRERQREISNESGRAARATGGESAGRNEGAAESGAAPRRSNRGFASMDRTQAARDREQGRPRGTSEGDGPRVRLERGPRGGSQGRRHRESQSRAHGRHRPSWRRSARRQSRGATSGQGGSAGAGAEPRATHSGSRATARSASPRTRAGQGTARQSGNSLGGERRPATSDERNVERP